MAAAGCASVTDSSTLSSDSAPSVEWASGDNKSNVGWNDWTHPPWAISAGETGDPKRRLEFGMKVMQQRALRYEELKRRIERIYKEYNPDKLELARLLCFKHYPKLYELNCRVCAELESAGVLCLEHYAKMYELYCRVCAKYGLKPNPDWDGDDLNWEYPCVKTVEEKLDHDTGVMHGALKEAPPTEVDTAAETTEVSVTDTNIAEERASEEQKEIADDALIEEDRDSSPQRVQIEPRTKCARGFGQAEDFSTLAPALRSQSVDVVRNVVREELLSAMETLSIDRFREDIGKSDQSVPLRDDSGAPVEAE